MSLRHVRRRCEKLLAEFELPDPFEQDAFREAVAARRGRPITMVPRAGMDGPCGVVISLPTTDYVFYESRTSPLHREHIVVHELGHLLCDHQAKQQMSDVIIRSLMPNLDPAMVRRALARSSYGEVEEQEAEMVASLVLGRRADVLDVGDPVLARLGRTLGAATL